MRFLSPRDLSNAITLKEAEVKNNIEHRISNTEVFPSLFEIGYSVFDIKSALT
jgi:hypothetical protein